MAIHNTVTLSVGTYLAAGLDYHAGRCGLSKVGYSDIMFLLNFQ